MKNMICFDHAAATSPLPEAVDFYRNALLEDFYNQEAGHAGAYALRRRLETAAEELSQAIFPGLPCRRVIWENSATALFNLLADSPFISGKRVAAGRLEHPALWAALKRTAGGITALKTEKSGKIVPPVPGEKVAAVCIHQVQSELGVIQDTARIFGSLPSAVKVLDAVQAAGRMEVAPDADITIISGAKFGSPCGSAMLIDPAWKGADEMMDFAHLWRNRLYRGGRIPYAVSATLAFTASRCRESMERDFEHITALNRMVGEGAAALGLRRSVAAGSASPYILHLMLPGEQGAVVTRMLSEYGILCSSGSACAAESKDPSPALLALGMSREEAYRGLRISFGRRNTREEVQKLLEKLQIVLKNF